MRLRFVEDRRTLVWAFVLFPLVPLVSYVEPSMVLWLVPVSLYLSFCAGVLTHNQNHCPVFASRRANTFYGAWLSVFYGFPTFSWIPTHNRNHHRYVNGPGDATRTSRHSRDDSFVALLSYPFASARWQLQGIGEYVRAVRHHPVRFRRILLESGALVLVHAVLAGLALALHGPRTGAFVYVVAVALPSALSTYFMMLTNYLQHVGCDPSSADDHSRNFTGPLWNWLVFDAGFHTVHHEHPGVHWSRYRALHEARAARIDSRLNEASLFAYVVARYLLGRRSARVSS